MEELIKMNETYETLQTWHISIFTSASRITFYLCFLQIQMLHW